MVLAIDIMYALVFQLFFQIYQSYNFYCSYIPQATQKKRFDLYQSFEVSSNVLLGVTKYWKQRSPHMIRYGGAGS